MISFARHGANNTIGVEVSCSALAAAAAYNKLSEALRLGILSELAQDHEDIMFFTVQCPHWTPPTFTSITRPTLRYASLSCFPKPFEPFGNWSGCERCTVCR